MYEALRSGFVAKALALVLAIEAVTIATVAFLAPRWDDQFGSAWWAAVLGVPIYAAFFAFVILGVAGLIAWPLAQWFEGRWRVAYGEERERQ